MGDGFVKAKEAAKDLVPRLNRVTERLGVRLQPVHYYSEVPDRRWLTFHRPLWARPMLPQGIQWDLDEQLDWLKSVCSEHLREVPPFAEWRAGLGFGPGFGQVEAQVLRCFIRSARPPRMVEVGSGMSTSIALSASHRNVEEGQHATAITCVEPFPKEPLRKLGVRLVESGAQEVDLSLFTDLNEGDFLFIDSTHAVRTGSDVVRLYLEVLPALPPGVVVHIHDIYLPYMFSPSVLSDIFDWQETALLAALLTNNQRLRVLCSLSALCHDRPKDLQEILPDCRPARFIDGLGPTVDGHFPASTWLVTA